MSCDICEGELLDDESGSWVPYGNINVCRRCIRNFFWNNQKRFIKFCLRHYAFKKEGFFLCENGHIVKENHLQCCDCPLPNKIKFTSI